MWDFFFFFSIVSIDDFLSLKIRDQIVFLFFFLLVISDITSETSSVATTNNAATKLPSSDSHSIQITTIKLKGDNFLCWSQSVSMYICGRGKIGYLTGEVKSPAKTFGYAVRDAENSMIMAWIVNALEEEISANYVCYPTAKEL